MRILKNMRTTNALGSNETKARAQSNCGTRFDQSIDKAAKNVATAALQVIGETLQ